MECNHTLEPRYDIKLIPPSPSGIGGASVEFIRSLTRQEKTYVGDTCTKCGKHFKKEP